MRLPIYRRLDERLQILGLNLLELSILGGLYVLLAEIFSFWAYGIFASLVFVLTAFCFLIWIHRRYESHFLQKWIRFAALPEGFKKAFLRFPEGQTI